MRRRLQRAAAPRLAALRLEPHELGFGSVRIGGAEEPPVLSFTIFNERASEVNFMLMLRKEEPSGASDKKSAEASKDAARDATDAAAPKAARALSLVPLLLHPRNGFIPPGGSCVVEVRCVAPQPGSQRYVVVVRNLSGAGSAQDLLLHIRARGVHPQQLWFPDLEGDPSKHVLSFGLCYIGASDGGAAPAAAAPAAAALAAATGSGGGAAPRRYVRKLPFRIANSQREPRHLCVTSNLAKQVFIFRDEECLQPATDVTLPAETTLTVWVCLQPHLSPEVEAGSICRQLVGGIKVALSELDQRDRRALEEHTVRLTATIGRSVLRLAPRALQLLCRPGQLPAIARVRLSNASEHMPLEWEAVEPPGVSVVPARGTVPGLSVAAAAEQASAGAGTELSLALTHGRCGFYRRSVLLRDLHCPHEQATLTVDTMVDGGELSCELPAEGASGLPLLHAGTLHAVTRVPATVPLAAAASAAAAPLELENKFALLADMAGDTVGPSSSGGGADGSALTPLRQSSSPENKGERVTIFAADGPHCAFRVRNCTALPIDVQLTSELPLASRFVRDGDERVWAVGDTSPPRGMHTARELPSTAAGGSLQARSQQPGAPFAECSRPFMLEAGGAATVEVRLAGVPRGLRAKAEHAGAGRPEDEQQPEALVRGKLLHFAGVILLERANARSGPAGGAPAGDEPAAPALQAISMTGSLCVSLVELLTPEVHLGRVGRIAGWRDVPFTFKLRNQSAVATTCEVEELAAIDVRGTEQGAGGALQLRLEAGETREVSAWLRTSQMVVPAHESEVSWHVTLRNANHPANELTLRVVAEVTVLRLRYTGLLWTGDGGDDSPEVAERRVDPRDVDSADDVDSDSDAEGAHEEGSEPRASNSGGGDGEDGQPARDESPSPSASPSRSRRRSRSDGDLTDEPAVPPSLKLDGAVLAKALEAAGTRTRAAGGEGVLAALSLPPLSYPTLPDAPPCSSWFELHNSSREPLRLAFEACPEPLPDAPCERRRRTATLRTLISD